MKTKVVGAFDAKTHFSQLLDEVEKGNSIEITRRGKLVARLGPPDVNRDKEGLLRLVDRVREERGTYGITAAEILDWKNEGRR